MLAGQDAFKGTRFFLPGGFEELETAGGADFPAEGLAIELIDAGIEFFEDLSDLGALGVGEAETILDAWERDHPGTERAMLQRVEVGCLGRGEDVESPGVIFAGEGLQFVQGAGSGLPRGIGLSDGPGLATVIRAEVIELLSLLRSELEFLPDGFPAEEEKD